MQEMITLKTFDQAVELAQPRRVLKYVLIFCTTGSATISVDEKEFILSENSVLTITSGQIHYFKNSQNAKGYILEFTYNFFCKDDTDMELIFHNGLFCHFAMNEMICVDNSPVIIKELEEIRKELIETPYQYLISVHSRIELILIEINRTKINRGDEIYKPDALFLHFLETVLKNFDKNLSVTEIATLIGTTESKLNELSKLHTNKTAQNVIFGLIISEAKRLFNYEKLSVKEVAYALGFNDPFYFSNFFKKHTNISPKSYKEKVLN
ncbi:AraC family transcriptional regulator [Flavobacterium sp. Fl-318]|uniref:AraC family transcriptional regulator n=1 Tax=Flavobacterium cupriresistens TaxID=2893885 RepID=A0ABU4RGU3_9FLAO|nr:MULTISPECIES: AraC family transcriptional regulator [unclassified Flavobacterium]MDX6191807.1 AraC family transcriptional regulator [Flavobacterium sp. Fl-318]UFH41750.1 AraC family transcriptional regulator [Flavobacterium sp. F-323]